MSRLPRNGANASRPGATAVAVRRAGFTLLEVMVALTLSGVAVALVAGSLWSAVDVRDRQARSSEAEHRARVTRTLAREVIRGMALDRQGRGELILLRRDPMARGAPSHRLVVSTRGGSSLGWDAGLKGVELLVDHDPATPERGLVARVLRSLPGGVREDTLQLMPEVSALQVRLRDQRGAWHTEWPDPTRPPTAVELRFLEPDPAQPASSLSALPLHVSVP